MLRCNDVVELVASDAWRHPPLSRRLRVVLHLAMCRHCRAYVRQLRRIGAAVRGLYPDTGADEEATARMARAVREAAGRAQPQGPPHPP